MKKDVHMAFIDLEKAFDRVPRHLIWQSVRSQGIPEGYIKVIADMYTNVSTKVRSPAGTGDEFQIKVGVHQGSALSPLLFNIVMDYLTAQIQRELPWDILYADDIVLIRDSMEDLEHALETWRQTLERAGLKISRQKTEYMRCSFSGSEEQCKIMLQENQLKEVDHFKYLGSVVANNGTIDADITHRINTAWMKWHELTGVLCDKRMPLSVKGRVYKTAIRPALIYGAECLPMKKVHATKMHATEMKMLRWAGGVTLLDKVKNNYVLGSFQIRPIEDKLSEKRLSWYGHIMRRPDDHITRRVLDIGTGPKKRGRPPQTWMSVVKRDMKNASVEDRMTQDRKVWRVMTRRADPN